MYMICRNWFNMWRRLEMLYQKPSIEIIEFEFPDVICTSYDDIEVPGPWD